METLKLTNFVDRQKAEEGLIAPDQVRSVEIEALVDTGATMLVLPAQVCQKLGLPQLGYKNVTYANGQTSRVPHVGGVFLELLDRILISDALVVPAAATALIGQIVLESLDVLVDPKSQKLVVNPKSPDAPMMDLLAAG